MRPNRRPTPEEQAAAEEQQRAMQEAIDNWPRPAKTFTPFGSLIAVWPLRGKMTTAAGVVLPTGEFGVGGGVHQDDQGRLSLEAERAEVVAVGPDVKHIKEGDVVIIQHQQVVHHVFHRGQHSVVMREDQCHGVELSERASWVSKNM
jgi:hypothetical protein